MSTAKRLCFLKRLAIHITMRSHTNCQICRHDFFSATTVTWSVCLSRTSILALMPLFFKASIRRLAAIAAPPVRSDVFMISTLIFRQSFCKGTIFSKINSLLLRDMKRKMIFVPAGGLANRIRATLSAIALAEQAGIDLRVIWFRDWALHAAFRDLFVPRRLPERVRIVEASASDLLVFDRPRQKNFHVPALFQKLLFRSCLYEHQIDALRTQGFDFEDWVKKGNVYMASYLPLHRRRAYPPHR